MRHDKHGLPCAMLKPLGREVGDLGIRTLGLSTVLNGHSTLQRRTEAVLALLSAELNDE